MVLMLVLCPLSVPLLLGLPFLVLDQVQHHQVSCDWRTAGHVTTVLIISDWSILCPTSGSMCPPPKIIIVFDEKYLIHSNINIQQYWREQDRKERCCASFNIVWIVSIIACSSVGWCTFSCTVSSSGSLLASGRSLPLQTLLLLEVGALLATLQGAPGQWAICRIRIQLRVGRYLNNFYWRLQAELSLSQNRWSQSTTILTKDNGFLLRLAI